MPKFRGWIAGIIGSIIASIIAGVVVYYLTKNPSPSNPVLNPNSSPPNLNSSPPNPVPNPNSSPPQSSFDADSASRVAQKYLNAKYAVFAPPFDEDLLASVATGRRYNKAIDSIKWLKENNAHYVYKTSEVLTHTNFKDLGSHPTIKVLVSEDRVFFKNGEVDSSNNTTSGAESKWFIFTFQQDRGTWKVENTEEM